jgi:hypothetical protein
MGHGQLQNCKYATNFAREQNCILTIPRFTTDEKPVTGISFLLTLTFLAFPLAKLWYCQPGCFYEN